MPVYGMRKVWISPMSIYRALGSSSLRFSMPRPASTVLLKFTDYLAWAAGTRGMWGKTLPFTPHLDTALMAWSAADSVNSMGQLFTMPYLHPPVLRGCLRDNPGYG